MNILYINDFAPPFPGSFFESLLALSKELVKSGHELYYIFPLERDYIGKLAEYGIVYYCPSFLGKRFNFSLLRLVYKICKKYKINIIHTNFGLAGYISGVFISGVFKVRLVAHGRSLSPYFKNNKFKSIRAGVIFKILNLIGRSIYIAISEEVKINLEGYQKIQGEKIKVIPNAVLKKRGNSSINKKKYDEIKSMLKQKKCVGMTAHFSFYKDYKTLIDAAELVIKKFPNVIFLLIGGNLVNDKINFKRQISVYISQKKLDDYFYFVGEVSDPMPYIELFNIGCLISNWEGFGNALVEYMLKKKPVIGTAVGGIKDIIDDGINGFLIPPKRADILAEKIVYLFENPDVAQKMGGKGYEKAVTEYNMDKWVRRIIQLYREIL